MVEVLVVIAVSVPLLMSATIGLMMALGLGARTERTQKLEADATSYAEVVKDLPYVDCATAPQYQSAAAGVSLSGIRSELTVTAVTYWDQDTGDYSRTECATDGSGPDDGGSQLVTIRASNWGLNSNLEVVKRDPQASAEGEAP